MPPARLGSRRRDWECTETSSTLRATVTSAYCKIRTASRTGDFSLVYDGRLVTPSAYYILTNGAASVPLQEFSSDDVCSSELLDPASKLPLPPRPSVLSKAPSQPTHAADALPVTSVPVADLLQPPRSPLPPTTPVLDHDTCPPTTTTESSPTDTTMLNARPANRFMLFRSDYCARVNSLRGSYPKSFKPPTATEAWSTAGSTVHDYYQSLAKLAEETHYRLNPDYKYKPVKRGTRQKIKEAKALERQAKKQFKPITPLPLPSTLPPTPDTAAASSVARAPSRRAVKPKPASSSVDVRIYDPYQRKFSRGYNSGSLTPPDHAAAPGVPAVDTDTTYVTRYSTPEFGAPSPAFTLCQVDVSPSPADYAARDNCTNSDGQAQSTALQADLHCVGATGRHKNVEDCPSRILSDFTLSNADTGQGPSAAPDLQPPSTPGWTQRSGSTSYQPHSAGASQAIRDASPLWAVRHSDMALHSSTLLAWRPEAPTAGQCTM